MVMSDIYPFVFFAYVTMTSANVFAMPPSPLRVRAMLVALLFTTLLSYYMNECIQRFSFHSSGKQKRC